MNFLPDPLTPEDCDIRGFPFLPLECARLRKSKEWLFAKRRPELGFYAVNLWTASWHEVPAASLEDDDDLLAEAAMCDPARWLEVRADVLRNWIKCSDGRLYHETVAEKALEAWGKKRSQSGNASKRWAKYREEQASAMPRHSDGNATAMQERERERKKEEESSTLVRFANDEGELTPSPSKPKKPRNATGCEAFDSAWSAWTRKDRSSKAEALRRWNANKAPGADKLSAVQRFLSSKDAKKDGGAVVPGFERWIAKRLDSFLEMGASASSPSIPQTAPLPTSPDWWASVADRLHGYEPKFWLAYGRDLTADPEKRILYTKSATTADRVGRRCDMLGLSVEIRVTERGRSL